MFPKLKSCAWLPFGLMLAVAAWGQSSAGQNVTDERHEPGAAREIGSGAGNIGTGVAKGTGDAAKGAAKGAGDLVTLHPVNAATSIGKGAAGATKNVTAGTAKGTGKMAKGIGRAFKSLF
jgi:hypothetical protein